MENMSQPMSALDMSHEWRITCIGVFLVDFCCRVVCSTYRHWVSAEQSGSSVGPPWEKSGLWERHFWKILPASVVAPHFNALPTMCVFAFVCIGRINVPGPAHNEESSCHNAVTYTPKCLQRVAKFFPMRREIAALLGLVQGPNLLKICEMPSRFIGMEFVLYVVRSYSGQEEESELANIVGEKFAAIICISSSNRVNVWLLAYLNRDDKSYIPSGAVIFYVLTWLFAPMHMEDFVKILRSDQGFALLYLSGRVAFGVLDMTLATIASWYKQEADEYEREQSVQRGKRRVSMQKLAAKRVDELVEQARRLFESQDYEEALVCYTKVVGEIIDKQIVEEILDSVPRANNKDKPRLASCLLAMAHCTRLAFGACPEPRESTQWPCGWPCSIYSQVLHEFGDYLSSEELRGARLLRDQSVLMFLCRHESQDSALTDNVTRDSGAPKALRYAHQHASQYVASITGLLKCMQMEMRRRPAGFTAPLWARWREKDRQVLVPILEARLAQMHDLCSVSPTYTVGQEIFESVLRACAARDDADVPHENALAKQGANRAVVNPSLEAEETDVFLVEYKMIQIQVHLWMASAKYAFASSGVSDTHLAACRGALEHLEHVRRLVDMLQEFLLRLSSNEMHEHGQNLMPYDCNSPINVCLGLQGHCLPRFADQLDESMQLQKSISAQV